MFGISWLQFHLIYQPIEYAGITYLNDFLCNLSGFIYVQQVTSFSYNRIQSQTLTETAEETHAVWLQNKHHITKSQKSSKQLFV